MIYTFSKRLLKLPRGKKTEKRNSDSGFVPSSKERKFNANCFSFKFNSIFSSPNDNMGMNRKGKKKSRKAHPGDRTRNLSLVPYF